MTNTPKKLFCKNPSKREIELAELVDGCYSIIELHEPEGEYNKKWKENWLAKARRLVPGCNSIWY